MSQHKRLALLAYLATATPRGFHSRDKLLALLWPESDVDRGRNSLRQSLHFLRRGLGRDALVNRGEGEIGVGAEVLSCDVVEFERALDEDGPEKAMELYTADLLEGFFIPGAPAFEQWLEGERTRLRRRAVAGAWALADRAAERGDHDLELEWARRAVDLDGSDEASVRRVIEVQGRLGNGAAAAQVYRALEERLERDYELKPSPETIAAIEAVRSRAGSAAEARPLDGQGSREPEALASEGAPPPAPTAPPPLSPPLRLSLPASQPPAREPEEPGPAIAQTRASWVRNPFQRLRRIGAVQLQVSIALVLAGMLASWAGGLIPLVSAAPEAAPVKAVAVLPFRTIGPEDDGQFISEAMHQEILTQLTRARTLRVIALGSVADLRIDMEDNRAVAQRLGAEYLIRGALQATGNRIRIWARLVDAATDEQLWASSFEGDRDDLFRIQLAAAGEIAEALEARFPVEGTAPGTGPTESAAAYEAYLKGRLHSARFVNRDDARRAAAHLEEAVRLDPEFADAWAVLSHTKLILAYVFAEHEELERAEAALRRAEALAPDDVETWLAEAYFHSYASQDYDAALTSLRQILEARPSHAEAMALQGFVERRKGLWEEAAASMTAALDLDPNSYSTTVVLAEMYMRMRRFDDAERLLDRAIAMSPAGELAYVQKALLYLKGRGDAAAASALLRQVQLSPKHHGLPALAALFANDQATAYDLLVEHSDAGEDGRSAEELIMLGLVHRLRGEQDRAAAWADSIGGYLGRGPQAAELASTSGGVWPLANAHGYAAVAFALSGRDEEAVANAERAVGWLPLSRDAYAGTEVLEHLAEVYALIGRADAAVETLDRLLSVPSRITPHVIRLHPVYRSMKGDPAFEALLLRHPIGP